MPAVASSTDDDDDDAKPYTGPLKKHRHDLGHEDHGAKLAAGTTKAIQGLLGLWIALTLVFVVYAMVDAVRSRAPETPAATTK